MSLTPPTLQTLSRLYYELGKIGARSVGKKNQWPYTLKDKESLFVLAADFSRFDPRLLQILVNYGIKHWQDLKPQTLRAAMQTMTTPQTTGVLASFIQQANPNNSEQELFWSYVTSGLNPVPTQFYFIGLYSPGGILAEKAATESLKEFKEWGFLGRETIVMDSQERKTAGSWDAVSRLNMLKRMLTKKKQIQLSDYLEELKHSISRQQALIDFKNLKLTSRGQGRGAYWTLKGQS